MSGSDNEELRVVFNPPLYLQRQRWVLDVLRREGVQSVLDIGCGEGSLLQCLTVPSQCRPPSNLPPTSPFVSGPFAEHHTDLYLKEIHGLDPHSSDLDFAISTTALPNPDDPPFTGYDRWRTREARWTPLQVNLWEGGFENINDDFQGDRIDAFVASEVIEHLPPPLLPLFAPTLLGYYRPRLVLLTTPNFTYNQRFSRPGEISSTGYPDPTRRTDRVFRHPDHKFEWTIAEWTKFCTDAAAEFGYDVDIGGVGLSVEPDPWDRDDTLGFASQVAAFRRIDSQLLQTDAIRHFIKDNFANAGPILRVRHTHIPHPLCLEELDRPPVLADIRSAVKDVMTDHREGGRITFHDAWRHGVVSLKCGGDIAALVKAFEHVKSDDPEWSILDGAKGWEGVIVLKNFVMPEDIVESQISSNSPQHMNNSSDRWEEDFEEATTHSYVMDSVLSNYGSLDHQRVSGWGEEENTWGSAVEGANDAQGWYVSGADAEYPTTLCAILPEIPN